MQVKFRVWLIRGANPGDREQPRLSVGESKAFGVKQGLIRAIRRNWPLQRFIPFQPVVVHSSEHRGKRGDFIHDLGRMLMVPLGAQQVRNLLGNLPIWPTALEWFKNLVESLDTPLGTGKGAFFFQAWCSGGHKIGITAGVVEKKV